MNLDAEQQAAVDLLQSGANAFLTGSAGTGKSTVTTAFVASAFRKVDIAATTGIASINLRDKFASESGGRKLNVGTIYRWGGFGLGPKPGQSNESYWDWWRSPMSRSKMNAFRRIKAAECLVVDEISMLPGRLLSYIDFHCRKIRETDAPFGGIQVVCVGDFLQLPPVDKDKTGYDWAFLSRTWEEAEFVPAMLKTVHRQDEIEFINLLNKVRTGNLDAACVATMSRRVSLFANAKIPRLLPNNMAVDKWNRSQMESLPGTTESFKAIITGDVESQREWLIKNLVTPYELELRLGARVMITANLTIEGELVASNGTMGTLTGYIKEDNKVTVETDDGRLLTMGRWMWDFDPQDSDSANFYQYPLRLAWASTIHKAQGLTLKEAWIDIRAAREPGQAYVALSRVRSLAGLHLKAVPSGIFTSPAAVAFHKRLASTSIPVAAAKAEAECLY